EGPSNGDCGSTQREEGQRTVVMLDFAIQGGTEVDGLGAPGRCADVGVPLVVINGQLAVDQERLTTVLAGQANALRRASLALAHLPARARRAARSVAFGLLERGQHPADAAPEVGLRGEPLVQPGSNLGRGHAAPATGSRRALKGFS